MKYNPGFQTDQVIREQFVVRQEDLDSVLEVIESNSGKTNQHLLVVGPRGSGKTSLVRRVAAEVRDDENYAHCWYPIVFGEEAYEVTTVGEFWLEAIFHLAEQEANDALRLIHQELHGEFDERRLVDRAMATLTDFAASSGRRLLLIVENLNQIFTEQMRRDESSKLCQFLIEAGHLMLLGTATRRVRDFERGTNRSLDFLLVHELLPLELDECEVLWESLTQMEATRAQVRSLQILTGGNPRLLNILSGFAVDRSFKELMENLMVLVDEHTNYFKSQLDQLSPQERKVFAALLELWDPATSAMVARLARLGVNKTSSLLKRLLNRGAVELAASSTTRKKVYQVSERLYNIYYLMRRRGTASNRVRAAVKFMVSYYGEERLLSVACGMSHETMDLSPGEREYHYAAFEEILREAPDVAEAVPESFWHLEDLPDSIRIEAENMMEETIYAYLLNQSTSSSALGARLERLAEAVHKNLSEDLLWAIVGVIYLCREHKILSEIAFSRVSDLAGKHALMYRVWHDFTRSDNMDLQRGAILLESYILRHGNHSDLLKLFKAWLYKNKPQHAVELTEDVLDAYGGSFEMPAQVIRLLTMRIVLQQAEGEVLQALPKSEVSDKAVGLMAILETYLGKQPNVAREIAEMSQDLAADVREIVENYVGKAPLYQTKRKPRHQ